MNPFKERGLVLKTKKKTDLLDDFMPMTQEWIVPEKCPGCGQIGAPKLGKCHNHKHPWFQLTCPDDDAEDKSLRSLFLKELYSKMGGDDCQNPLCDQPTKTPKRRMTYINKQRFQRPYQGFAIAVNRIRTKVAALVEVPI